MTGMLWLDAIIPPTDVAAGAAGWALPAVLIAVVAFVTALIARKRRK